MTRGSRKNVLDWTSQSRFLPEFLALVKPIECRVSASSIWQPIGHSAPREARLEHFSPAAIPGHVAWPTLRSWWLQHTAGANTPNWDIALSCEIEGRPGLILVEAKANVPELSSAGKSVTVNASQKSQSNHTHIANAIAEARDGLAALLPYVAIDRDRHYQLSNRLAFGWKLASLGIPTVLVYLGFTGDQGIRDVGMPIADDEHWQSCLREHLAPVCSPEVLDAPLHVGPARLWVLARSRPVLEESEPLRIQGPSAA
jgi:hypothetical protein